MEPYLFGPQVQGQIMVHYPAKFFFAKKNMPAGKFFSLYVRADSFICIRN